jgi:recombination protein RecA
MNKEEKLNAIKTLSKTLDKQYDGEILQYKGEKVGKAIPCIPSNILTLDNDVIGCGGLPRGRVIEIYGQESSGKTALSLHIAGECQKAGGVVAFIDAEHSLDPSFANTLGVDMDELVTAQPDFGEQAMDIVIQLVESNAVDMIIVDSVTALVPRAELEGDMGDSHMGLHARLLSQSMRKLVGISNKHSVAIVFINQIREKVGLVFGNPEVTTGGRALKFFSSLRLEVRRVAGKDGFIKDGDVIIGHRVKIKGAKNKVGTPFKEGEVSLLYGAGFDKIEDAIDHAVKKGIITGSAWLVFKGEKYRREDLREKYGEIVEAIKCQEESKT